MSHASYLVSARTMALGTPPLAWFCADAWPVFTPPLTPARTSQGAIRHERRYNDPALPPIWKDWWSRQSLETAPISDLLKVW